MALRRLSILGLSAAWGLAILIPAGHAAAQDSVLVDPTDQLFISPSGKPYRAPLDKPYPVGDWFAAANTSHNGKMTKAEFRADAQAFFRELDRNKNGVIESAEVAVYERLIAPEIIQAFTPDRPGAPDENKLSTKNAPQGAAWYSFMGEPEPVTGADRNFDGRVTLEEFLKTADERFDLIDAKGRGYITLEQLPETPLQTQLRKTHRNRKKK